MKIANIVTRGSESFLRPPVKMTGQDMEFVDVFASVTLMMAVDPLELALKDLIYLEAAARAQADGADAVFINAVPDYGLPLMEAALDIPVVGAGRASLEEARKIGDRYAFVTVWPESTRLYYDRLIRNDTTGLICTATRFVTTDDELMDAGGAVPVMASLEHQDDTIADAVLRHCVAAVEGGAESIILGCTCMSHLTEYLSTRLDVPVIDPLATGIVSLRRELAVSVSAERTYHAGLPLAASAVEAMAVLSGVQDEACEVCVATMPTVAG